MCCAQSLKSCLALCDPMDCSPSGSSVHGILQARILEWVARPSFGGYSRPRDQTCASLFLLAGRFFTTRTTTWEDQNLVETQINQAPKLVVVTTFPSHLFVMILEIVFNNLFLSERIKEAEGEILLQNCHKESTLT